MQEQRVRMGLESRLGEGGEFEILAITAGEGNGWRFGAAALRASLPLWQGVKCFVDHAWQGRSLRDLAGICCQPRWDEQAGGVRLSLQPVGPSADLLRGLGRDLLALAQPSGVGFSADLVFQADGRQVQRILRVHSVDLVLDPARGGGFVRAVNSQEIQGETNMQQDNDENLEGAGALRQARACLLETALCASRLPPAAAGRIRSQFAGRDFEPQELRGVIEDAQALVSELTGAAAVQGPGRVEQMLTSEDQVGAAVHDLLGLERPEGMKGARVSPLSGIRELYTLMTGDVEFVGGYHPERARFAASADLPGVLKNAMNKMVIAAWQELGRSGYRWWEPLVTTVHFNSLQPITGVLVGEIALLPSVSEGAAYQSLDVKDSAETASWGKYGGYIGLTLEMFERDETHRLRQYPQKLASSALRRISNLVGSVFTSNSGAGPAMADTYNVFHANHKNLTSGSNALSSAAWETAGSLIYNQQMLAPTSASPNPALLALDPKYAVVPRALRLTAMQLLYPSFSHEANIFSENMQRGQMGDVLVCPEMNDANDWAAAADPLLCPGIILAERFGVLPEIFIADNSLNGALFTNDEIRLKARHWISVFVADHRPLYKANVP